MLLSAAVLDLQLYIVSPAGHSLGLKALTRAYGDPVTFDASLTAYLNTYDDDPSPLLQVVVQDFLWSSGEDLADLRVTEKQVSYYSLPSSDETSVAVHDLRAFTKNAAILGIITTFVICVVLATGSLLLAKIT